MVGTAYPLKVSNVLLDAAQEDPQKAIAMINTFSRSMLAPPPSSLGPGTWVHGAATALNRRVLASNPKVNVLYRGFKACDSYAGGDQAIAAITCPVLFVLGTQDQMTQAKAAQPLIALARAKGKRVTVQDLEVGHHLLTETPDATLFALRDFINS